ncbi:MAG: phosphoethanolamine--lipid A transferase [Hyphomicrobium sp.]|nr:phosphoethanolamine--lipid A transferase [Hyphomicrobium sp.]
MARRITITPGQLCLLVSLYIVAGLNTAFWGRLLGVVQPVGVTDWVFVAASATILIAALNAVLTAAALPYMLKPVAAVLVLLSASAAYFIQEFGTAIDANMVRNVLETNAQESGEFLTAQLFGFILLMGIIPVALISIVPIRWPTLPQTVLSNTGRGLVSCGVAAALIFGFYANLASTIRENRALLLTLVPSNVFAALGKYHSSKGAKASGKFSTFGEDAHREETPQGAAHPLVTVLVVGETARSANFSLNGYARETNPRLARIDGLVSLKHASSCGTDTAQSVPCMFSGIGEAAFTVAKAAGQENLLHILKRAGLDVLWRDNQSGCKGVCNGMTTETLSQKGEAFYADVTSHDEVLLDGLEERLVAMERGGIIVLHMIGSHGPAYFKRVPAAFARFKPTCDTSQLSKCTTDQIVNSYDNTILYTDHVLAELIRILGAVETKGFDTAMIYVSDHGESLGEKGLYLHGMPRALAPKEQTHIPMIMWASHSAQGRLGMDMGCLQEAVATKRASHDNLFHTVLGMFAVRTRLYDSSLDVLHHCRNGRANRT